VFKLRAIINLTADRLACLKSYLVNNPRGWIKEINDDLPVKYGLKECVILFSKLRTQRIILYLAKPWGN